MHFSSPIKVSNTFKNPDGRMQLCYTRISNFDNTRGSESMLKSGNCSENLPVLSSGSPSSSITHHLAILR